MIWLVVDVPYLCHRIFHQTKNLSWEGQATGTIFGFFKTLQYLQDTLGGDHIAFCFEGAPLLRKKLYPGYKQRRHSQTLTPEELEERRRLDEQIERLYRDYLPRIGWQNVFRLVGYESDDLMAVIARDLPEEQEAILITGDLDLLQCLRPHVSIYLPTQHRMMTLTTFRREYLIRPGQWAVVKALAGCRTDEVRGVPGIGEITALKYIRGELSPRTKQYQAILSPEGRAIVRRNRPLVQLPFLDCPPVSLVEDRINLNGWREVCGELGMRSLAKSPPGAIRKRYELS